MPTMPSHVRPKYGPTVRNIDCSSYIPALANVHILIVAAQRALLNKGGALMWRPVLRIGKILSLAQLCAGSPAGTCLAACLGVMC